MDDSKKLYVILTGNAASYRSAMRGAKRETVDFAESADDAGDSTRRLSTEINSMSGRLGIMLDALALFGPAVVPIAAVAVPAMSGLANVTFAAAVGAGAAALAFIGLGDAVGALREYELDPTAENLEKVDETLSKLAPSARTFALELNDLLPQLARIKNAAADGLFPGALEAMDDVEEMIPRLSQMMREYADSVGDVAADAGDAFSSERGRKFLRFLQGEARPAITAAYDTLANLTGGMGELWMAMDPANDEFTDWLVTSSQKFDEWAQKVNDADGPEEFLDYLHETGPEVAETLSALADGMMQILIAAAPMGGVVLDGLEAFGNAVAMIADSPIGPTIFAGLAAVTALNRGLAITAGLMTKSGMSGADGKAVGASPAGIWGALSSQSSSAQKSLRTNLTSMRQDVRLLGRDFLTVVPSTTKELERNAAAASRVKGQVGGMARAAGGGAAAMGALAIMSTESGQALGLTNTAMFGMIGAMRGPWAAAAGATIGLLVDMAKKHDMLTDAIEGVDEAIADADFRRLEESLATVRAQFDDSLGIEDTADVFDTVGKGIGAALHNEWNYGDFITEEKEKAERAALDFEQAVNAIGMALDENFGKDDIGRNVIPSIEEMQAVADSAAPAMRDLGLTWEQISNMDSAGQHKVAEEIRQWTINADSADGRLRNVGDAIVDLGNDALSTADSADQLATALQALLDPAIEAEAATDAWHQSLKTLRQELKSGMGFEGFKKGAVENREVSRAYYDDSMARLVALANLTETSEADMARAVAGTRREFIEAGIAAGVSRKAMVDRANAMGLTPKLVRTVFEAAGLTETEVKARNLADLFKSVPKKVQTDIAANGIPETKEEIDALVEKYKLTEQERTALVAIRDMASADIQGVIALLEETAGKRPNPDVSANTAPARTALDQLLAFLRQVDGTTATTIVYTKRVSIGGPQPSTPGEPQPPRVPGGSTGGSGDGGGGGQADSGRIKSTGGGGGKTYMFNPNADISEGRVYDLSKRVQPTATTPQPSYDGRSGGGKTTVIRHAAPLIGSLTVPEGSGANDSRAGRVASAVVRETSLAVRSGRWSQDGDI